jgi:hypothetical protein
MWRVCVRSKKCLQASIKWLVRTVCGIWRDVRDHQDAPLPQKRVPQHLIAQASSGEACASKAIGIAFAVPGLRFNTIMHQRRTATSELR